ncbi:MAG: hypothetical protein HY537_04470 [Deltaproteobacteria bacterium]|nr:hypothetical protein [Deltaproteobacteria bacterium]
MKKILIVLLFSSAVFAAPAQKKSEHHGHWMGAGGLGFSVGPGTFLLAPQLEYAFRHNLLWGVAGQVGFGEQTLFTLSATGRYLVQGIEVPHLKPFVEGGLGLAGFTGQLATQSSIGFHILLGLGADYQITPDISLGSVFRANFAPPAKTFFFSWPVIVGRMRL